MHKTGSQPHLLAKRLGGGGDPDGGDFRDEGQHVVHGELGDAHDEGLAPRLQRPLQLLLAVHLEAGVGSWLTIRMDMVLTLA